MFLRIGIVSGLGSRFGKAMDHGSLGPFESFGKSLQHGCGKSRAAFLEKPAIPLN
jgi:hypothetical protein